MTKLTALLGLSIFLLSACASPVEPSPGLFTATSPVAAADAKPNPGVAATKNQTFAVYGSRDVKSCNISGWICGATVTVYLSSTTVSGVTSGSQGKVTLPVEAGTWRVTATAPGWCYDQMLTLPTSWVSLRATAC